MATDRERIQPVQGVRRFGDWTVDFDQGLLRRQTPPYDQVRLNRRLCKVLCVLVSEAGGIIPASRILEVAWRGRMVGTDSISTAIYQLRKALGDDTNSPQYIETIPNEGYRLVANVAPAGYRSSIRRPVAWATAAAAAVVFTVFLSMHLSSQSIARTVFVPPVTNSTGIESNEGVSIMLRSRLMNALGRNAPEVIATVSDGVDSRFTLESEMIGCESGPAVVFRLVETASQRHVWSEHYDMSADALESFVLEAAVQRVSDTLAQSESGAPAGEGAATVRPPSGKKKRQSET